MDEPALSVRRRTSLSATLRFIDRWGCERDWVGTDPYEGLNATRFKWPLQRSELGRRVLIQLVKRSPVDLRPFFRISPSQNSAAVAQLLSSYALGSSLPEDVTLERLASITRTLEDLRVPQFEEPCWGYPWNVQTRAFFYPRTEPNTIATAFAGLALLDAFERTGHSHLLDTATGAGDFFLRCVAMTEAEHGAFFGYFIGDRTPIHNANMLVCALLARLSKHVDREDFRDAAKAGVEYAIGHQRPNGSWAYGEVPSLEWVDNFHTGYVLDCLLACLDLGFDVRSAIDRGLDYYRRALFLEDGTPKYLSTSIYPIDAQCVAQGIQTFSLASHVDPAYAPWAWKVYDFAMLRMQRSDGAFIFQRRRFWTNQIPHLRWVMAPMMLALTHLSRVADRDGPGSVT